MVKEKNNPFVKAKEFSEVVENPLNLSIFLSIAKASRKTYSQLMNEFDNKLGDVGVSVELLERSDLIAKNPDPLSKKFKLSFNGQLFAEQLKNGFPKIKEFLGDKSLVEPLKLKV